MKRRISKEDKNTVKYLRSRGWHQRKDKMGSFWYDRPNPGKSAVGMSIDCAFGIATSRDKELDEKVGQRDGTIDIRCNKCGVSCAFREDGWFNGYYGLIRAKFSTGYYSKVLPDGMSYRFSLCEQCVAELMLSFKIKAEEYSYL